MLAVRNQHPAFSRGDLTLLYPRNRAILAYIRSLGDERILCLANLSRTAQAVELDLSEFRGCVPIEMTGRSPFPPIGDLPYLMTLPAHGFFWFLLAAEADAPRWHTPTPDPMPDFITLTTPRSDLSAVFSDRERRQLTADALPEFLKRQRWFGAKGETATLHRDPADRHPGRRLGPAQHRRGRDRVRRAAQLLPAPERALG